MKVISIGTDRKIFEEGSAVLSRQIEYAAKMDELHLVVRTLSSQHFSSKQIGNLFLYPTQSFSRFLSPFDAYFLGKKIAREKKFILGDTVVSTEDPFESGFAGYLLRKKFGFPLQLQVHTDFLSLYFKNSPLNYIRLAIAKYIIPKAQGLRVISSNIADSLRKKFPNLKATVDVLPIFVDVQKIMDMQPIKNVKQEYSEFDFVICMASRLSPEKRIDVALKAFKKVLIQFPKTGLVIAGDGSQKNNLQDLAEKLGIAANVVFLGWQDDVISYYKTADMFLLTSEFEGYGMSLVEAGTAGSPIVTTAVGIAQTSLFKNSENAFVCQVGDANCLAQSIIKLILDPKKRELFKGRMQDSIRQIAVSREQYVSKYAALLQSLILT